jgi:S1-C subfamily serine protease
MERIVLRHLSGSKANQVEEFPLNHIKEIVFGRDPSATVKYDPDRDDLVGRQHARIAQDPNEPTQFTITDLNSRNGTFVNRQKITGTTRINVGDTVQFGAGGPEFQFDLEPRPANATKPTRIAPSPLAPTTHDTPPTRVVNTGGAPGPTAPSSAPRMTGSPTGSVGKATVERMISHNVNETKKAASRKFLFIGGAAFAGVVVLFALVGAGIWYMRRQAQDEQQKSQAQLGQLKQGLDADKAAAAMKPNDIVKTYGGAVVKIDVVWKLVSQQGNGLVYHQYLPINGQPRACYVRLQNGKLEPYLTYTNNQYSVAIGGAHSGTGFAVSSDGFILTNRHVAATWETAYTFPASANMGIVLGRGADGKLAPTEIVQQAPRDWVPAHSKQDGIAYDGRNDRLDVTFQKSERRLSGKVSAVSPRHDVAMIKIDSPGAVTKVELQDNYDTIEPGDPSIVLGYPGVSPPVFGIVKSQDVFNRETEVREIPDPTVSVGNIGRVLRGQEASVGKEETVSMIGDAYQLTINSTGAGNSGGPVFNDHGKVIGIFFAGLQTDAAITFAVPIRYGLELMGTK